MNARLHHPGLVVPDLDRALAFYCSALGFECIRESSWEADNDAFNQIVGLERSAARVCMLKVGSCYLEIFQYEEPASAHEPACLDANDHGIRHLAFEVDDVQATLEKIVRAGGEKINDPVTSPAGVSAIYCRDPFGNLLELIKPANEFPRLADT